MQLGVLKRITTFEYFNSLRENEHSSLPGDPLIKWRQLISLSSAYIYHSIVDYMNLLETSLIFLRILKRTLQELLTNCNGSEY